MTYSNEERARARNTIRRLDALAVTARQAAERGIVLPTEAETAIVSLTGTSERVNQVEALHILSERMRNVHLAKLKPFAAGDFNSFCEYVNPDEPPESRWHIYLTNLLQSVETEPGNERFVLNCPPGHAKPLSVETLIAMADGTWKKLGDVRVGDYVTSHLGRSCLVSEVHDQGELDCLKITTEGNRQIVTAPDHSFLVEPQTKGPNRGPPAFRRADSLRIGSQLCFPARAHAFNSSGKSILEFELAAFYQANGGRSYSQNRKKTRTFRNVFLFSTDAAVIVRMRACLDGLSIAHTHWLSNHEGLHYIRLNGAACAHLSEDIGFDTRSEQRRIPEFVFKGGDAEIRRYLDTFIAQRGDCTNRFLYPRLHISFNSRGHAHDVSRLLARYAVPSRVIYRGKDAARVVLDSYALEAFHAAGFTMRGANADRLAPARRAWVEGPAGPNAMLTRVDPVKRIETHGKAHCRCLTVEEDHTFIAEGIVVHNSTYASRLFVAWRMGRRPRDKIIGGGHSQRFVENEFSKKIRSLVGSPAYRDIFPNNVIDSSTRAADQWALAGTGGQYVAKGAGQAVHGFRANFACIDDPYARIDDAESPTIRENVKTWFFGDIGSRLLPGAVVFLIMTRFHEDDLTGSVIAANLKLAPASRYRIVEAPAICYDPETDILNRGLGEVLWDYYNLEYFQAYRATWSYQRFSLVFQQLTGASDDTSIASKLKFYRVLPYAEDAVLARAREAGQVDPATNRAIVNKRDYFRRIVASVDTASKKTERADFTVVQIWGETHDRKHYLIAQVRGKWEFPEMVREIEKLARLHAADCILVEDKGQGTAYIQARGANENQRRLAPCPVVAISVPSNQGKEFRFDEITPMIEAGDVFAPETADWIDLFVRELGQFPDGGHDDQVDAMTQYLKWVKSKRTRYGSKKVGSLG